jgi:exodeoxyribonuclease VII large subunit
MDRIATARQRRDLAAARLFHPGTLLQAARRDTARAGERLAGVIEHRLALCRDRLTNIAARLRPSAVSAEIGRARALTAEAGRRLDLAIMRALDRRHDALDNFAGRLASHSERHESLVARGYVVVRDHAARIVTAAAAVSHGAALELEFHDGRVGVIAGTAPRRARRRPAADPPAQGRLFG